MDGWCSVFLVIGCVSLGIGQIIKSESRCVSSEDRDLCYYSNRRTIHCPDNHVILITEMNLLGFNESIERTYCRRHPELYCPLEISEYQYSGIENSYGTLLRCSTETKCHPYFRCRPYFRTHAYDDSNCSITTTMLQYDYICISNSSFVNMEKTVYNRESSGELSLSYNYGVSRDTKINGSFYCACQISSPDDAMIYPTVNFLKLNYKANLTIYARNWNITYSSKSDNMLRIRGSFYEYNKRLNKTSGPLYAVYASEIYVSSDKALINFRIMDGRLVIRCDGRKNEEYKPPLFEDLSSDTKQRVIQKDDTEITHCDVQTDNGYKSAFISLMVIVILAGITIAVAFIYLRKDQLLKYIHQKREKTVKFNVSENDTGGARGRQRQPNRCQDRGRTGEEAAVSPDTRPEDETVVSDQYDCLNVRSSAGIYGNINQDEHIYDG